MFHFSRVAASRIVVVAALVFGAAACGDDSTPAAATESPLTGPPLTGPPLTGPPVVVPQRIISLSPTHTEILFAIGAGDQVIAIDDQSNFPAEALLKQHDLSGYEPSVEAISALDPDLVIVSYDPIDLSGQLGKLGIEVYVGDAPATFDDVYAQFEQLGAMTGHIGDAAEVVARMQTEIEQQVSAVRAAQPAEALTYYHELDPTFYSVTSDTFAGQVYGLFGLTSVADGVEQGNDYPQMSSEYIVSVDPDLVFLADSKCCGQSADTIAARPGWDAIAAVKAGRVDVIDDDIASRWGPRLVDFVRVVAAAIVAVPVGG